MGQIDPVTIFEGLKLYRVASQSIPSGKKRIKEKCKD